MPFTAKDNFDHSFSRTNHLIVLYDLLHDTRERDVKTSWIKKFNDCINWGKYEKTVRIDGKNHESILILRETLQIQRKKFESEYVDELLRSAIVFSVSSLDRFLHDIIVENCIKLLSRKENDIPKGWNNFSLPIIVTKKALEKIKKNSHSRAGFILKQQIQEILHQKYIFQGSKNIESVGPILGIKPFWDKVVAKFSFTTNIEELKRKIDEFTRRRNQIVHEADLVRKTKAKGISLRPIKKELVEDYLKWIKEFVNAFHQVVNEEIK